MSFRNADVLYAAGGDIWEKYGTFVWRTLPSEEPSVTFSRSGTARFIDRGIQYRAAEGGAWRPEWVGEHSQYGLRLERAVTPQNDDSVAFDPSSDLWAFGGGGFSSHSSATSIIANLPSGGEARQFDPGSNSNARLGQSLSTFSGGKEALFVVVEMLDTSNLQEAQIIIRDTTGGSNVAVATYDANADDLSTTSGDSFGFTKLSDDGPNGGVVVKLWATGTGNSSNNRAIWVEPQQNGNQGAAVLHYAHHVELAYPTSPIPYTGSAGTRNGERFAIDTGPRPTKAVGYLSFIAGTLVGQTGSNRRFLFHGGSADPRLVVYDTSSGAGNIRLAFVDTDGNLNVQSVSPATIEPDDHVEVAYAFDPADGNNRVMARVEGGTAAASRGTPSSWTTPTSFSSEGQVGYNENEALNGNDRAAMTVLRHYLVRSDAPDNDPFTGDADSLLDELAAHTV